jgi:hypothetical protein
MVHNSVKSVVSASNPRQSRYNLRGRQGEADRNTQQVYTNDRDISSISCFVACFEFTIYDARQGKE